MISKVALRLSFLILLFFFFSCTSEKIKKEKIQSGFLNARVYLSAGDINPLFNELNVPSFFNLAKVESTKGNDVNSVVLGEKKSKGHKLSISPIALLSFNQDTLVYKYVIAVDSENERISHEYNDFLMNNYYLQQSIESWFKSQCPSNSCNSFKWENTYKALLEVNN